jgi:ADP-heptose:LPS heptosyltransferase
MPIEPRSILVIHVAGLTWAALALPALRSLRSHFPNSRITLVSSPAAADLLRLSGCADEVFSIARFRGAEFLNPRKFYRSTKSLKQLRRENYDLAIELSNNAEGFVAVQAAHPIERLGRKKAGISDIDQALERLSRAISRREAPMAHAAHEYLRKLEPLGVRPIEAEPRIATSRESDEWLDKLLGKQGAELGELLVGIHPGAGAGKPRWPIERFASIGARMIHNFNARVLAFAGPNERGSAKRLAAMLPAKRAIAIQSPKIADFVSAAARTSLFIANHSGPAHVAAAAGAPVVVASTCVKPSAVDLLGNRVEHIRAPHVALISEEEVYEAACRMLKTNRADFLRWR